MRTAIPPLRCIAPRVCHVSARKFIPHLSSGFPGLALAAAFIADPSPATAQTASSPRPIERDDGADTVVLSPFVINAERDTGFVAASSLAGGRLAGELRDTPVAYSVITRDFIDALAITDAFEAASWSPNTVIAIASNGGGRGDDVSSSPGSYNVRGAGGGRGQRNFFLYFAPNDSYAVERFDFSRGPNAILFGNGGLGGVATTMTKQARFGQRFGEISQTVGTWYNIRTTVDYNQPVAGDRAAVRVAAVWGDTQGWRDRQFDTIHAAFATASFRITRQTTLRVEGEYGESWRNQTFSNLTDNLSGWDGKTTFSGTQTSLPSNANQIGVSRRGAGYLVYDPFSGVDAVMNYQNDPITMFGGQNAATPMAGFTQVGSSPFGTSGSYLLYALGLPASRFDNAIAGTNGNFRLPSKSFSLASDKPVYHERYRDLQATVDHRIGNLFMQAAADFNWTNQNVYNIDVRGSNQMFIDINRLLPNGAPNPHFLQPYADGQIRRNMNYRNAKAGRFAIGYAKDAGRWGNYTANVMGGTSVNTYMNRALNLSIAQNPDRRRWGSTGSSLGLTDIMRIRRYWNEGSRPYLAPERIRFIDPINRIDREVDTIWAVENDRADSQQFTKTRYNYAIAAFNAKYFRNRLVVLGAVRVDDYFNRVLQQQAAGEYDPNTWDGVTAVFKPAAPDDWAGLMYIPRDASGRPTGPATPAENRPRDASGNRQPQYANDRFKDDFNAPPVAAREMTRTIGAVWHATGWISPYVNYAETFNPPGAIQRIDTSFLPPTVARGVDIGVRSSLLGNRLNVTLLHYINKEKNAAIGDVISGNVNSILGSNHYTDNSEAGRNALGIPNVPGVIRDIQDREATGWEFEMVANVTRSWRISCNHALPKVYSMNAYPDATRYLQENDAMLRRVVTDAGGVIDPTTNLASANPDPALRGRDTNNAVNAWNNLRVARASLVTGKRLAQNQPAFNFYTDYTIGAGPLRGVRLGGGVQWRARQIAGYRGADTIVDPADPTRTRAIDDPSVDAYTPVYTPASYHTVVATVGYTWRLPRKRELILNLRVNNLLNHQGPIYAGGSTSFRPRDHDYASPARMTYPHGFYYREPISMKLTSTLKF